MEFTDQQWERYARHIVLEEIGEEGQAALLSSKVLIVGAGGLGSPLGLYLAAAGIGTIGIVDDDQVALSNLQRQIAHRQETLGIAKTKSLREAIDRLNSDICVVEHPLRLTPDNITAIAGQYDLIADASDNFPTRYLINDTCYGLQKPWVSAALLQFEGQLSTFKPHQGDGHPCYRCLYPEMPPADFIPRCEQAGILGSVAGVMGTLQATEIIKELLHIGQSLSGRLMLYDALSARFTVLKIPKNPSCSLCATQKE